MSGLSSAERESLDRDGYVLLLEVADGVLLERLREAFEHAAAGVDRTSGTRHVEDMSAPVFDLVRGHTRMLDAMAHVLGERCHLRDLHGRDPLPGFGQQGLHTDWIPRPKGAPFMAATSIWLLDDFTASNGATRLVPSTHLRSAGPPKAYSAPNAHHPDERVIAGPAGAVLAFNGHIWHSGTRNASTSSRRALQCVFVATEMSNVDA